MRLLPGPACQHNFHHACRVGGGWRMILCKDRKGVRATSQQSTASLAATTTANRKIEATIECRGGRRRKGPGTARARVVVVLPPPLLHREVRVEAAGKVSAAVLHARGVQMQKEVSGRRQNRRSSLQRQARSPARLPDGTKRPPLKGCRRIRRRPRWKLMPQHSERRPADRSSPAPLPRPTTAAPQQSLGGPLPVAAQDL